MARVKAIISDFGGVLTSPMIDGFRAFEQASGVSLQQLGAALAALEADRGAHPLFELETGRISEPDFLHTLGVRLSEELGRPVELGGFGERYFEHLHPNAEMIEYMRALRARGHKMAICTNNVREWEPLWRAMLPVAEIFQVVVDSAFVGVRKPDAQIYQLTLERLEVPAAAAVLVDDIELNCVAARELGLRAVWFRSTEQAIRDIEQALSAA